MALCPKLWLSQVFKMVIITQLTYAQRPNAENQSHFATYDVKACETLMHLQTAQMLSRLAYCTSRFWHDTYALAQCSLTLIFHVHMLNFVALSLH